MKISYTWLQDFIDLDALGLALADLTRTLNMIGLAVEAVEGEGNETIFDLEVTTNRPDCLNHLGVARELAAQFRLPLKKPDCSAPPTVESGRLFATTVVIKQPKLCPRYACRVMTNVGIEESPDWLKRRLESLGQRPINNIVDITNYVLLEAGHPLHAFDYERLKENRIVVRTARAGETLVTLDGTERQLDRSMLAICDAARPVALAGIMGGHDSQISTATDTILLESAYFAPSSIRSTAKTLAMRTEASYRFERGADPEMPVKALNRACRLIEEIAGGRCVGPVIDEYPNLQRRKKIRLTAKRLQQVVGISFDAAFIKDILSRLEFELAGSGTRSWSIQVPTFRPDVEMEDDLVEEIARHYGYDRIESTYPVGAVPGNFHPTHTHMQILTRALEGFGFFEALNYTFSTPQEEALFWGEAPSMIPIANPLTEEDSHLRTTLAPGLVQSVRRNFNYGNKNVRLFEFGKVFIPGASGRVEDYREVERLELIATGAVYRPFWSPSGDDFEFYHLKGIVEALLYRLDHKAEFQRMSDVAFLHPGVAAEIVVSGQCIGWLGQLHPRVQESYKFLQKIFLAELSLETLYRRVLAEPIYVSPGKFPSVESDFSFIVDKTVEYYRIESAIQRLDIPGLWDVCLIDLYQGATLPKDRVSLTVRLTFVNSERTLTQEEVNRYSELVFSALRSTFGAEGRS